MIRRLWSAVLAAGLVTAGSAQAANRHVDPAYLCDGRIAPPSALEYWTTAALTIGSGGVLGLLIPLPGFNPQPAEGQAGLDACTTALAGATHPVRRSQLSLARAIHRLELKDFAGALDEARAAPGLAGPHAEEPGYKRSLGVAGQQIEALALVGLGRDDEAQAAALRMAAAAPLDLEVALRVAPILRVSRGASADKLAFYARAAKLDYRFLAWWNEALESSGDFAAAAALGDVVSAHTATFDPDAAASARGSAGRAVRYALAGDLARSELAAQEARALLNPAEGAAAKPKEQPETQRLLLLRDIVLMQAKGRGEEARKAFRDQHNWGPVSPEMYLAIIERLAEGLSPEEARRALREDPAAARASYPELFRKWATRREAVRQLFSTLNYESPSAYAPVARIWNAHDPSPMAAEQRDLIWVGGKRVPGEVFQLPEFRRDLGRQALMLHAALRAKAHGAQGFALGPASQTLGDAALWVVYGNPGDRNFPVATTFVADDVIAELAPRIPKPSP